MTRSFPPLQVVAFVATRRGDPDRGPLVRICPRDAQDRLIQDGELVWVYGPRRHEMARLQLDPDIMRGCIVVRDVLGVSPTDQVRLLKLDTDRPLLNPRFA